ncbi:hypothetical protein K8I61_02825 [bacterium]|nr:hypothetical protein [bacterium]
MNPPSVFLEDLARPLVVIHAVCAFASAAVAVHLALWATNGMRRGKYTLRGGTYARILAIVFGATIVAGFLAYPTYRYFTRAIYLDRQEPWAANLFDIKENLGLLLLPVVAMVVILQRAVRGEFRPGAGRVLVIAAWMAAAGLIACVLSGLFVVLARGV